MTTEQAQKDRTANHPGSSSVEDPGKQSKNTVIKSFEKEVTSNGIISLGNEAVNPFLFCLLWFEPTRMHYPSPLSKTRRRFPATVFSVVFKLPANPRISEDIVNLVGKVVGTAAVTLLSNGELENVRTNPEISMSGNITYLDTLTLGEGNPGLVLSNDEDVGLTGSELVVKSVANVDDVETTIVTLTVSDDTNTTHVATTSGHDDNTGVELDEVEDLASGNVNLDGVVDLDGRVGVADAVEHAS